MGITCTRRDLHAGDHGDQHCKTPETIHIAYWTSPAGIDPKLPPSILVPAESSRTIQAQVTVPIDFTGPIKGEVFLHYYGRSSPPCYARTEGLGIVGRVMGHDRAIEAVQGSIGMLEWEIERLRGRLEVLKGGLMVTGPLSEAAFIFDDIKKVEEQIAHLHGVAATIKQAKLDAALKTLRTSVSQLRSALDTAALSGAAPQTDGYYTDARTGFRDGRDLVNKAQTALSEGRTADAADLAKKALGELSDAEQDVENGVKDGSIGSETARALREFIDEAKKDAQDVITETQPGTFTVSYGTSLYKQYGAGVTFSLPDDKTDPRDEPPPVIFGEEIEAWVRSGAFEPVQGVWQDDERFTDKPGKQLTQRGPWSWKAELPMVLDRPTLIFGTRAELHRRITMKGLATGSVYVPLKFRLTLRQASGEKIIFEERQATHKVPIEGKAGPPVEWIADLDTESGWPTGRREFKFLNAGPYQLVLELVRGDGSATGLKVTVDGTVVAMPTLKVQFAPIIFRQLQDFSAFEQWTQEIVANTERYVPKVYPLAEKGFQSSLSRTEVIIDPPPADPLQKIADWLSDVPASRRRQRMRLAALEARLGAQAALSGAHRAVALMDAESFGAVYNEVSAAGVALSEDVLLVKMRARMETVAHELAHSFPYLWSDDEMKQLFGFTYHNSEDDGKGNGFSTIGHHQRFENANEMMSNRPMRWIGQGTYWHLLNTLPGALGNVAASGAGGEQDGDDEAETVAQDGARMIVRGYAARSGGRVNGTLDRAYDASPEMPAEGGRATSEWYIVQRNGSGQEVARDPIPIVWRMSESTEERPLVAFTRVVNRAAGATQLELVGPGNTVVDRRAISRTAPTVRITAPSPGTSLPATRSLRVQWEAADADGDPLTATVLYSPDGGRSWQTVSFDQPGTSIEFPVTGRPRDARIRVLVTDGARSGSAEATFGFVAR